MLIVQEHNYHGQIIYATQYPFTLDNCESLRVYSHLAADMAVHLNNFLCQYFNPYYKLSGLGDSTGFIAYDKT